MCNEVRRQIALGQIRDDFLQLRIPLRFPEGLPNLASLESIRITDPAAIVRTGSEGAELVMRRWSWPGPAGKPVYNFRSENRDFTSGRCIVLVDGFYEFTKPADPKAKRKHKWLFTLHESELFGIAGLWRNSGEVGEAFTLLTGEPGPDVAPYHHRQVVVLPPAGFAAWLDPQVPAADSLRPLPAGSLAVEQIC
jgi:putative SOS response-associated peptidase YedK